MPQHTLGPVERSPLVGHNPKNNELVSGICICYCDGFNLIDKKMLAKPGPYTQFSPQWPSMALRGNDWPSAHQHTPLATLTCLTLAHKPMNWFLAFQWCLTTSRLVHATEEACQTWSTMHPAKHCTALMDNGCLQYTIALSWPPGEEYAPLPANNWKKLQINFTHLCIVWWLPDWYLDDTEACQTLHYTRQSPV